jgi:hypothetical protein
MPPWLPLAFVVIFVGGILFAISKVARPKTPVLSVVPAPCPVCAGSEIYRTGNTLECANCHSILKGAISSRALWIVPIMLGFLAAMYLTIPLQRYGFLTGVWLAAVRGGLAAGTLGLCAQTVKRSIRYRVAKQ